jgi:hypothetical protein
VRRLHRYKNSGARLCPLCREERRPRRSTRLAARDAGDELVLRMLEQLSEPVTLAGLHGHLRRHGHGPVGSPHGRLELLELHGAVRKCSYLGEIAWRI